MVDRKGWLKYLDFLEQGIMIFSLIIIIVLICTQVLLRYLFGAAILWGDEVVGFLFVLMTMVGSAVALREGLHTKISFLDKISLPFLSKIIKSIKYILIFGFLVFFLFFSAIYAYENRTKASIILGISMVIPYAFLPFGTLLMLIEMCHSIFKDGFKSKKKVEEIG